MIEVYGINNSDYDPEKMFEEDNSRVYIGTYDGHRLKSENYTLEDLHKFDYVQFKKNGSFKKMVPHRFNVDIPKNLNWWYELTAQDTQEQMSLFDG